MFLSPSTTVLDLEMMKQHNDNFLKKDIENNKINSYSRFTHNTIISNSNKKNNPMIRLALKNCLDQFKITFL